jgi:hypothetical protein
MGARAAVAVLLALLAAPGAAAAKDRGAPVRVLWISPPPASATWTARFSLLQGPGALVTPRPVHPVVVVTDLATNERHRFAATPDGAPNVFRAAVRFPADGDYAVTLTRFDPARPARVASAGRPVHLGASPSADAPWVLAGLIAAAGLVAALRRRHIGPKTGVLAAGGS